MARGRRNSSLGSRRTARSGRATRRGLPLYMETEVLGNLRVAEVLQVSSLVSSHDGAEVEPIGDFKTDAFAFLHSELEQAPNETQDQRPRDRRSGQPSERVDGKDSCSGS